MCCYDSFAAPTECCLSGTAVASRHDGSAERSEGQAHLVGGKIENSDGDKR